MNNTLPEPQFIACDAQAITAEMITTWETMAGKTLQPAQVERLLIDQHAYRETLVRIGIQEAAKQNLLAFAQAPMLDYLGELMDTPRLPAQPARSTVRITFQPAKRDLLTLAAGLRVATQSGMEFMSTKPLAIFAEQTHVEFIAVAVQTGPHGNGYLPGQINQLRSALPLAIDSIVNLSTSCGGMDVEDDERYRQRIRLAPERFSWGSENRYRWAALSSAAELIDVQVISPSSDGRIEVIVLAHDGPPSPESVQRVQAALDHPQQRMLGDRISVKAAAPCDYNLQVEIDVLARYTPQLVIEQVKRNINAWAANKARQIGGDLVPAQIKTALGAIDGLYDVRVLQPAHKQVLDLTQWPRLQQLQVTLGEVIDDV